MDRLDMKAAMKGVQWEIAKGHLRALVAIEGSVGSDAVYCRLEDVDVAIGKFIADFENRGLHE